MSDWSAGYVADIGYTFGYYTELNPLRIKLAFLNNGLVYPEVGTACELGFGQGLSTNIHAAASVTKWYGTDFNPAQAAYARDLAEKSGADATLYDDSFAEFLNREDLPDFDYIGLHGIWSWVSDENRSIIVEFIRRKLKVGGVVYISYNTLPGWAAFAPMRHLMTEHAEIIGSEGRGIVSRINDAIEFADKLLETNPMFARANPLVGERIKKLKEQNRHYLAHEYFNRDWHPMHFSTMAAWLEPAKLQYACSASYMDHIDLINLTADQQVFLNGISDLEFKESVRDFMVNQQFRRDYWVKGYRKLSPFDQAELVRKYRLVLVKPRSDVSLQMTGSAGEVTMNDVIYNAILDVVADHKPKTIGQIESVLTDKSISLAQIMQATIILSGSGALGFAQEDGLAQRLEKQTDKLNALLYNSARGNSEMNFLASPVIGGGVSVSRVQQLFILAISQGSKGPENLADFALNILSIQGQKLVKDGVVLDSLEDNKSELLHLAAVFIEKHLPVLRSLRVA